MELIREFRREDIPEVLVLFRAAFLGNGKRAPGGLETYFDRVFFESPWYDPELPSFVHLDARGTIIGFVGVQPRRLVLRGRRLRAAVATKLMVSPSAHSTLLAVRLLSRAFAGPQDLMLSDLSNEVGRRIWEGLGGETVPLYSLKWQRPLRPVRHSLAWLHARGVPGLIAAGLKPLASAADALVARWDAARFRKAFSGYTTEDLPPDLLATRFPELCSDRALRPEYDPLGLQWLLGVAQRNEPHRPLRQRLVRDPRGAVVGWFLYFLQRGGESEVIQLVAARGAGEAVFHLLLADAWGNGATMLSGRLEPGLLREPALRHCYLRPAGLWTQVHSRRGDLLDAIRTGSAFLSRLEGEW